MPSYKVTFATTRELTAWMPDGASDAQKAQLAMDHISMATFAGEKSKLLSVEPSVPAPPPTNGELTKQIIDSISHLKPPK